jgi:ABC-type dipeptide/oligopeptide/nickel transport system permease subunit
MALIPFDVTAFRALFSPAFDANPPFSDAYLQAWAAVSTSYISNNARCNGMSAAQTALAINLMTAHLVTTAQIAAAGGTTAIELSATIDKISVSNQQMPAPNQWQYWLQTTPYGQQLLALLQIAAAGGRMINGYPVFNSLRR